MNYTSIKNKFRKHKGFGKKRSGQKNMQERALQGLGLPVRPLWKYEKDLRASRNQHPFLFSDFISSSVFLLILFSSQRWAFPLTWLDYNWLWTFLVIKVAARWCSPEICTAGWIIQGFPSRRLRDLREKKKNQRAEKIFLKKRIISPMLATQ